MRTHLIGAALSAVLCVGAAKAADGDYNGNWPITISQSQYGNGSYCLTLNSGAASLTGPGGLNIPNGNFQVIGRRLVASIAEPYGGGFNVGLVFNLPARNGILANGTYIDDNDGYLYDTGLAKVGTKDGC